MKSDKVVLPWTDNANWARNEFSPCNVYNPESSTCSDLMVSDEWLVVELNVTLSLQLLDMIRFPGNIITMISLLNIHAPVETLTWLESVTLLPTGRWFWEAYILWLYAGARDRKRETDNIQSSLTVAFIHTQIFLS